MTRHDRCKDIQELISAHLDEELGAAERAAVRQHLSACPSCTALLGEWSRLRGRVRGEEPAALDAGFASRIRAAAAPAAGARAGAARLAWRAAAALLLLASLAGAWLLGREDGLRTQLGTNTHASGRQPLRATPASAQGARWRAARGVVTDLRMIDRVPEPLQRPLLQAELDHFGLDGWARRLLAERDTEATGQSVARLIRRLNVVLGQPTVHEHMAELRNEARRIDLGRIRLMARPHPEEDHGERNEQRIRVVMRVGKDLPTTMRTAIDRYLSIKEALVAGRHLDAVSVYQAWEQPLGLIGPAVEVSIASALEQAGLPELSLPILQPLQHRHPELFEQIRPLIEMHLKHDAIPDILDLEDLKDMDVIIRKALRTIDGTLHIQHGDGEGGMSLRIVIPQEDKQARKGRPERRRL